MNIEFLIKNYGRLNYIRYFRKDNAVLMQDIKEVMGRLFQGDSKFDLEYLRKIAAKYKDLRIIDNFFYGQGNFSAESYILNYIRIVVYNLYIYLRLTEQHQEISEKTIEQTLMENKKLILSESMFCSLEYGFNLKPVPSDNELIDVFKTDLGFKFSVFLLLDMLLKDNPESLGVFKQVHDDLLPVIENKESQEVVNQIVEEIENKQMSARRELL